MKFLKKIEIGLEEILLMFLILIELLDFFTAIPPELEFIEKAFALIAMTYLFYKVSITRIFFGKKEKFYDAWIVISWFMISINTVVGFAISASEETVAGSNIYTVIVQNFYLIEKTGFIAGTALLLALAYLLIKEPVKKDCLMQIIHEQKKVHDWKHRIIRFFVIYILLLAFYLLVYSFAIEWLAITVDAPIIVIVMLAYLILIVKRHRTENTETFLERVSAKSEELYEKHITLFHSKKTIWAAITGILALHLIVEVGHFIIPYITGLMYTWYFKQMGPGHEALWVRVAEDLAHNAGIVQQAGILAIYALNLLAIAVIFLTPAYLWWHMYHKKPIKMHNTIWIAAGSLAAFALKPVLQIKRIDNPALMGADITTQTIPGTTNIGWVLIVVLLISAIFYILGRKNTHKTSQVVFIGIFAYFGYYLYQFFTDVVIRYISATTATAQAHQYYTAVHLLIFLTLTIAFYIAGYLAFAYKALIKQKV